MNAPSPTVTVDSLPALSYRDVPVITTELLAQVYGTEPNNLRNNFARNEDRFEAGKHYFRLEGEALRQFKGLHCITGSDAVEISPRTRNLTLWTHRGAARHAKMLDTDLAWEVFEQLEDAYFLPREAQPEPQLAPTPTPVEELVTVQANWKEYALFLESQHGRSYRAPSGPVAAAPVRTAPRRLSEADVTEILDRFTAGESRGAIARALGISARTVGRVLDRANADADPQIALRLLDGGAS
jgi:hypothetical protein